MNHAGWLLAIETSHGEGSIALAKDGVVVASRRLPGQRRNATELLPEVRAALIKAAIRPESLAGIAFSGGPGSFTGLRVAATVARMLHSVWGTPVSRISTLEAIAENALADKRAAHLMAMVAAKQQQVFAALLHFDGACWLEMTPIRVLEPIEVI